MASLTSLTLVIPAFNEEGGIADTIPAAREVARTLSEQYQVEILLVDDGSRDRTPELLREAVEGDSLFRIVTHEVNRGLGAAIRTGFQNARGDIIVTTDFDRTYDYSTIPEIVALLESSGADLVSASPYHPKGAVQNVPQYRLLFSYGASLLYRLLVSWRIYTWTALFRAYRRPVAENIHFESNDFLAGAEILVRSIQKGYKAVEYPTVLYSRTYGQSSIRIARVTLAHIKFQLKLLKEAVFPASRKL